MQLPQRNNNLSRISMPHGVSVLRTIFIFVFFLIIAPLAHASTTVGTVSTVHKYAWSNVAGYVNFAPLHSIVTVTDSTVSGYAWSENDGWINLSPTYGGVRNNGKGVLTGFAWDERAGWINFSGVTINSSGVFHGTATGGTVDGASYAINFDCSSCDVQTDWRPASKRVQGAIGVTFTNTAPPIVPLAPKETLPSNQASSTSIASTTSARRSIAFNTGGAKAPPVSVGSSGESSASSFGKINSNPLFSPHRSVNATNSQPTIPPPPAINNPSSLGTTIHRVLIFVGTGAIALFVFLLFRFFL